jgi:hypothetical protein
MSEKEIKTDRRISAKDGNGNRTVNIGTRFLLAGHRYKGSNPNRSSNLSSP